MAGQSTHEDARTWLADQDVTEVSGQWVRRTPEGEQVMELDDLAHEAADAIVHDESASPLERLRISLSLIELLDRYAVTMYIGLLLDDDTDPAMMSLLWDTYRLRLEASEPAESIIYSLWVDWFEDRTTAEMAFTEVLGRAVDEQQDISSGVLARRTKRVLAVSGPVPWPVKQAAYEVAAALPVLHDALFEGIYGSRYDVYGDIDPSAALALLAKMDIKDDRLPSLQDDLCDITRT